MFSLAADFYTRLRSGRLGYERIAQFKQHASILGYTFDSEGTDPTLTAFDRPTVEVYRRTAQYDSVLVQWKQETIADPGNPEGIILKGISQFRAGAFQAAQETFEQAMREHPELKLAELCRVEAIYRYRTSRDAQARRSKSGASLSGTSPGSRWQESRNGARSTRGSQLWIERALLRTSISVRWQRRH